VVVLKLFIYVILIGIVLGAVDCSQYSTPAAQDPCGYVQNAYGQRVSLKNGPPIKLYFDANFPTQYYADVQTAIQTWETAIGHQVFDLQPDPQPASTPGQDGLSIIYWLDTWDPSLESEQANTTIYWDGDQITEADMKFDASYYSMSDTPSPTTVDMQSLVLHELGHVLGLKHDDPDQSVMDAYLNSDFERRTLYSADISHLQCEY
jgi:hypothetical protein